MLWLCALLPSPVAQPRDSVLSPVSTSPGLLRPASSAEQVGVSPRIKDQTCQVTDAAGTCCGGIGW